MVKSKGALIFIIIILLLFAWSKYSLMAGVLNIRLGPGGGDTPKQVATVTTGGGGGSYQPSERELCISYGNEWDTAKNNPNNYYFYLWRGIDKQKKSSIDKSPIILHFSIIKRYIPSDVHKDGEWTECRINLNLKEVKSLIINPYNR